MPRINRVYTRSGDDGTTSLGSGQRVPKESPRIRAFGSVDELNSLVGVALASSVSEDLAGVLRSLQNDLFHLGADLCVPEEDKSKRPGPKIESRHVQELESLMDRLTESLPPLENFVLPGGSAAAAALHVARAVCRRAETQVIRLSREEPVGEWVIRYLNRLSDALFVMARHENQEKQVPDTLWDSRA